MPHQPAPLDFDPIDRAGVLWERNWRDEDDGDRLRKAQERLKRLKPDPRSEDEP